MFKICDLHTHSVFSDGTFTPEQLIDSALEKGISALALTDHNTVSGLERFLSYAKDKPVDAVAGVEFSTGYCGRQLHIIGLFIQKSSFKKISDYVSDVGKRKEESNRLLISKLKENGYEIDYGKLYSESPSGNINRAHIASELFAKGYADSVDSAFKTILSPSRGFYTPPERLSSLETISFISEIGALPVLAHPLLNMNREEIEEFIPKAVNAGLAGIETLYTEFDSGDTDYLKRICSDNDLAESGGSDFHGSVKPDIMLGSGRGNLSVPYELYLDLKKRVFERRGG